MRVPGSAVDADLAVGVHVGTAWDYTDRVARREPAVALPRVAWSAGEWRIIDGAADATPGVR